MKVIKTKIPDVIIIEPQVFGDERGFFMETWQTERYKEAGIASTFVQDNLSLSSRGVLRGLHFQRPRPQGKLVSVLMGEVYDVAVDIRQGSPTFGQWVGEFLSAENKRQLYVPEGLAHGFCVTSEQALFSYKCTDFYHPPAENCLCWDDPDVGVEWPLQDVQLSGKDKQGKRLKDFKPNELPTYNE